MSDCIWKNRNSLIIITVLILLAALFLPRSVLPEIGNRSLFHLWESGHLLLFFLGSHVLRITSPRLFEFGSAKSSVFLCAISIFIILVIEWIQSIIDGKSPEISDFVADTAGVLLYASYRLRHHGQNYYFLHGSALVLASLVFWPVFSSLSDEILATHQFPLLADFETPFEASRFEGATVRASISDEQAFQGQHSLRLSFYPGPWSGIMLKHFPSNWLGYAQLQFAVYNPGSRPVALHVRIHDALHEQGNKPYSDLYSRIYSLPAGIWTKVRISLSKIQSNSKARRLDMASVRGLGFFVEKEEKPLALFLDSIRLEKEEKSQ